MQSIFSAENCGFSSFEDYNCHEAVVRRLKHMNGSRKRKECRVTSPELKSCLYRRQAWVKAGLRWFGASQAYFRNLSNRKKDLELRGKIIKMNDLDFSVPEERDLAGEISSNKDSAGKMEDKARFAATNFWSRLDFNPEDKWDETKPFKPLPEPKLDRESSNMKESCLMLGQILAKANPQIFARENS
ncbi:MAG: hypothetical protein K2X27_10890 [Candidatus Obscuribacterales bacterium]|nr:hypothetical protein [Candidatus Obscuribacterales bacterium]